MTASKSVTVVIPEALVSEIDKDRADVPRSKFLLRLIEESYENRKKTRRLSK